MKREAIALMCGGLFAAGLIISGMTQPAKVVGFLDMFGDWDPSLLFVMAGALMVFLPFHRLIAKRSRPVVTEEFCFTKEKRITPQLVIGAALFGTGWGLAGYCPGPAFTSVGAGTESVLIFTGAMVGGFVIARLLGVTSTDK